MSEINERTKIKNSLVFLNLFLSISFLSLFFTACNLIRTVEPLEPSGLPIHKILASDGSADYRFGYSVSISGDYAVVGAYGDEGNTGSAYIFQKQDSSWVEANKLTASDGDSNDWFGYSVSISGDYAIIGAYSNDGGRGTAYIFKRMNTNWLEITNLLASDGETNDFFGYSVSISTNRAVIGAYSDDVKGDFSGSAYIFERQSDDTWMEVDKLTASNINPNSNLNVSFGSRVSLSSNFCLVGALWNNDYRGAAYIFERQSDNTWTRTQELSAGDRRAGDTFGYSTALSSNTAIIGAPGNDSLRGSAYIFEWQTNGVWIQSSNLTASDRVTNDNFGFSVSISEDFAIIGAYGDDMLKGSAYVFEKKSNGNWSEVVKLTASDGNAIDGFGYSVSISGNFAIIGASGNDGLRGSAYVFENTNGNWSEITNLTAADGGIGDQFGFSVSILGDVCLIGARGNSGYRGAAYVFQKQSNGEWIQTNKLTANDGTSGDQFGFSVSLREDFCIVGANSNDNAKGAAYIFQKQIDGTWIQSNKLVAGAGSNGDQFGFSVSAFGDNVAMSTIQNDSIGSNSGVSYIFQKTSGNWVERSKLFIRDQSEAYAYFGRSVAISGDNAIIGAFFENDQKGSAYLFERQTGGNWLQTDKLAASDSQSGDLFGYSVSISGDYAVISAHQNDDDGNNSGSAYIFQKQEGNWSERAKIIASDGVAHDNFGYSVFIDGDFCLVGAKGDNASTGSAYLFNRSGENWNLAQKFSASDGKNGDQMGVSVSLSGEHAIMGSYFDDDRGNNSGSSYWVKFR